MKLPNREQAFVPPGKLENYLLSETHPVGGSKAKFLREAGFDKSNSTKLEEGLIGIAQNADVVQVVETERGTKFVVDGIILAPSVRQISLRTVWIIEPSEERPRFVTAYPT